MNRNFNDWLSTFRDSIADYGYYVDFAKIYKNIDKIKKELCLLNVLIGEQDIENKFIELLKEYPKTLNCIPILLAVRANEIYTIDEDGEKIYNFKKLNYSEDQYVTFMQKTGLFDLMQKHLIRDLVDYVTGVETGLDTNARKNRGGDIMENLIEKYIIRSNVLYYKEMKASKIQKMWSLDLSGLTHQGQAEKKFDFVIKTESMVYGIETNFYTGGGSKLNETARSYKTLALEAKSIDGFTFVWFTDGKGWHQAKNNLKETFDVMDHLYNIQDIKNGIMNKIFI